MEATDASKAKAEVHAIVENEPSAVDANPAVDATTAIEEDDDEDDDDEDDLQGCNVQLGFLEPYEIDDFPGGFKVDNNLFYNKHTEEWDGGKVGGWPIWLNPNLPDSKTQLACKFCEAQLSFLLQVYCPLDDVEDAYHRALYLFCCRNKDCIEKSRYVASLGCGSMQWGKQGYVLVWKLEKEEGSS